MCFVYAKLEAGAENIAPEPIILSAAFSMDVM
jgi:hypothetical protein